MSCGVGRRHGSDPTLLGLWRRPAAVALIRPLVWEPPYGAGVALKSKKKKKKLSTCLFLSSFLRLVPPPASWAQSLSPKHISSLQTFSEPTQVTVQGTPKQVSPSTLRCLPLYCTEWVPGQGKPELLHHRKLCYLDGAPFRV